MQWPNAYWRPTARGNQGETHLVFTTESGLGPRCWPHFDNRDRYMRFFRVLSCASMWLDKLVNPNSKRCPFALAPADLPRSKFARRDHSLVKPNEPVFFDGQFDGHCADTNNWHRCCIDQLTNRNPVFRHIVIFVERHSDGSQNSQGVSFGKRDRNSCQNACSKNRWS